jgi:hypothetical protein
MIIVLQPIVELERGNVPQELERATGNGRRMTMRHRGRRARTSGA